MNTKRKSKEVKVSGPRRQSRELILQALFQLEFTQAESVSKALDNLKSIFAISPEALTYAETLAIGISEHLAEIDSKVSVLSKNWSIDRLGLVDKNIIRIALFEILFVDDVPDKVAINEALEVAKKYGNTESAQFINGILDQALKEKT